VLLTFLIFFVPQQTFEWPRLLPERRRCSLGSLFFTPCGSFGGEQNWRPLDNQKDQCAEWEVEHVPFLNSRRAFFPRGHPFFPLLASKPIPFRRGGIPFPPPHRLQDPSSPHLLRWSTAGRANNMFRLQRLADFSHDGMISDL